MEIEKRHEIPTTPYHQTLPVILTTASSIQLKIRIFVVKF
jgi:hypothetical protein